jgi:putative ABC transport system substrate-binding protein
MQRREFIKLIGGAAAWPLTARAQRDVMPVVGVLSPESPTTSFAGGLRAGLQELGYVEGQNIRIEYRWGHGNFDQLPDLAAELVRVEVNVIVAFVTQASLVAKKATATIPIVIVGVADPIDVGLIASLARPGGNITGTSSQAAEIVGKQLGLLKDTIPHLSHVAALWNPANRVFQAIQVKAVEDAAITIGVKLQLVEARAPADFDAAFAAIDRQGTRVLLILADPLFSTHYHALAEFSERRRLVAMAATRNFTDVGGLMAYGPNYFEMYKRAATYVDKILKGAVPGDLPVEQPTKFEFVINLKTAKALGLTIPSGILAIADEVIE